MKTINWFPKISYKTDMSHRLKLLATKKAFFSNRN